MTTQVPGPQQQQQWGPDPRASAAAEKAYRRANRKWYQKKRFIIPLGFVALLIISPMLGLGGGSGSSSTSAQAPVSRQTAQAAAEQAAVEQPAAEQPAAEQPAPEPATEVTVSKLLEDLDANPLAAANTWNGKQVTVTGYLSNIDAQGDYFSLVSSEGAFELTNVSCDIGEEHLGTVMGFTMDQEVTVTGKITDVGEVLGYRVKVESIG